jgi:hypothetical protein
MYFYDRAEDQNSGRRAGCPTAERNPTQVMTDIATHLLARTTFRTMVTLVEPQGRLPARWRVQHWCGTCHQLVPTNLLVSHADDHNARANDPLRAGPSSS